MLDLDDAARRAARGDVRAFRIIVDATSDRLYRLALRVMIDADDASDVLQDAYVHAHRSLVAGHFKGEARPETWLYRIVLNTALNHRRGRIRRAEIVDPPRMCPASPEMSVDAKKVMAIVQELPQEQRVALVLKELEGRTSSEIAGLLGCSEGAIEQRLVRARDTLRRKLGDA